MFASLNNTPFADGYQISHPALRDGAFVELLNSDASAYGGGGVTNVGQLICTGGAFNARLPANGVIVFQRVAKGFVSGFLKLIVLSVAGWARRFLEKCERNKPLIYDAIMAILAVVLRHLRNRVKGGGRQ